VIKYQRYPNRAILIRELASLPSSLAWFQNSQNRRHFHRSI